MRYQIIEKARTAGQNARNTLREELQWVILGGLHDAEAFRGIAFLGGTCLRLCHGLQRFSEDLDFSLTDKSQKDVLKWLHGVKNYARGQGFSDVEVMCSNPKATVVTGSIRFPGLLFECGASPHIAQKLMIKVEIDCNPPAGAKLEKKVVATPSLMALSLYELPSLMAGKLHAILSRPYTKGRDWYDLIWYGSKGISPNLTLLQNALVQIPSEWCDDAADWQESIIHKSTFMDWEQVRRDVQPFLENQSEITLLAHETIKQIFIA